MYSSLKLVSSYTGKEETVIFQQTLSQVEIKKIENTLIMIMGGDRRDIKSLRESFSNFGSNLAKKSLLEQILELPASDDTFGIHEWARQQLKLMGN